MKSPSEGLRRPRSSADAAPPSAQERRPGRRSAWRGGGRRRRRAASARPGGIGAAGGIGAGGALGAGPDVGADGFAVLKLHAGGHVDVAGVGRLQREKDFLGRSRRQRAQLPDDLRVVRRRLRRRADERRGGRHGGSHADVVGGGRGPVLDENAVIDFLVRRRVGRGADVERHQGRRRVARFGGRPRQAGGDGRRTGQRRFWRHPGAGTAAPAPTPTARRPRSAAPRSVPIWSDLPPIRSPSRSDRRPWQRPIVAFPTGFVCPDFPIPSTGIASPGRAFGLPACLTGFAPSPKLRKSVLPRRRRCPGETHVDPTYDAVGPRRPGRPAADDRPPSRRGRRAGGRPHQAVRRPRRDAGRRRPALRRRRARTSRASSTASRRPPRTTPSRRSTWRSTASASAGASSTS